MGRDVIIGVDIGGTKVLAALVRGKGRILARRKTHPRPNARAAEVFKTVCAAIDGVLAQGGGKSARLKGIGVAVPGIADAASGNVVSAPNINLSGFPIGPALKKRYKVPAFVGNDVNLAVLGEQRLGAGRGVKNLVGIFPGTGLGGGVIIDGRILHGAHGAAAELGHMIVEIGGPKCGCGNRGCLEAFASRRAIERAIRHAVKGGERSIVKKLNGGRLGVIKSKIIRKALKRGDPVVSRAVLDAAEVLGAACVTLRHTFDPEIFLFGGGLVEACGEYILPVVRERLKADPFFAELPACLVAPCELGDDAVVLGAASLAAARN